MAVGAVLTGAVGVAGEDLGGGGGGRRGRRGDGGRAGGGRRHAGVHVIILGRAHRMTLQVERRGRCDGHGATATEVICGPPPPGVPPPLAPRRHKYPPVDRGQCVFLSRPYQVAGTKCAEGQKICKNRPTSLPRENRAASATFFAFPPLSLCFKINASLDPAFSFCAANGHDFY